MKSKLALLLSVFSAASLVAAPVGHGLKHEEGIFMPSSSEYSVAVAYEADFVSDARMEEKVSKAKIEKTSFNTHSAVVTLSLFDKVNLSGQIGVQAGDLEFYAASGDVLGLNRITTESKIAWGVGADATLAQLGDNTAVAASIGYQRAKLDLSKVAAFHKGVTRFADLKGTGQELKNTNLSAALSARYGNDSNSTTAGVFYNRRDGKWKTTVADKIEIAATASDANAAEVATKTLRNIDEVGVSLGLAHAISKSSNVAFELRAGAEKAMSFSLSFAL